jgi:hypothetical protein
VTGLHRSTRIWYALLAGLSGWMLGVVATIPFEAGVAARYAEGQSASVSHVFAAGMLVWSAFALVMAAIPFLFLVIPFALVVPPEWIVRRRKTLILAAAIAASLAMGLRLHIFEHKNFVSLDAFLGVFWIAPNVFAIVFAATLTAMYAGLAKRRPSSQAR